VAHYDLYRLNSEQQVRDLDLKRSFEDHITIIEWPDRIPASIMPKRWIEVGFELDNDISRVIRISAMP
jgi:tRNA A37 threonylcarbamoyladenosine biosynthesis protein TsaE